MKTSMPQPVAERAVGASDKETQTVTREAATSSRGSQRRISYAPDVNQSAASVLKSSTAFLGQLERAFNDRSSLFTATELIHQRVEDMRTVDRTDHLHVLRKEMWEIESKVSQIETTHGRCSMAEGLRALEAFGRFTQLFANTSHFRECFQRFEQLASRQCGEVNWPGMAQESMLLGLERNPKDLLFPLLEGSQWINKFPLRYEGQLEDIVPLIKQRIDEFLSTPCLEFLDPKKVLAELQGLTEQAPARLIYLSTDPFSKSSWAQAKALDYLKTLMAHANVLSLVNLATHQEAMALVMPVANKFLSPTELEDFYREALQAAKEIRR